MDAEIKKRRDRLGLFFKQQLPLSRNAVCQKTKVSESTVGAFLRGGEDAPQFLTDRTYGRLATWSGWTIAELKGDAPAPSSEGVLSRKSGTERELGNDSARNLSKTHIRTDAGPESEGDDMGDRLFFEILDKIEALPPRHLHRLRVLIDRIDGAQGRAEGHPRKAVTAE